MEEEMEIEDILKAAEEENSKKFKSIVVNKILDVDYDLGNLLVSDRNQIDEVSIRNKGFAAVKLNKWKKGIEMKGQEVNTEKRRSDIESYFKNLARDNVQLLVGKLWELPSERVEDVIVAKLPDPKTRLPREKPLPEKKVQTKWETFARMKGIQNRKKGRMIYDEELKKWVPRWGYNKEGDAKDWLLEVPDQADPNEDQFAKKIKAKKERVAKNELQRLRNLARNSKGKVPGVGLMPTKQTDKTDLSRQLSAAKTSTASLGRFDEKLPKEKPVKNAGKKRKFEPNFKANEKEKNLGILKKMEKGPILDANRAANLQKSANENSRSKSRKGKKFDRPDKGDKIKKKTPKKVRGTSSHSKKRKFKGN